MAKNDTYLKRYVSFINHRIGRDVPDEYVERHHILPVSLFKEYKKTNENIISLTGREHFIAHWMLAKCLKSNKMWFAFNQMRRVGDGSSILYTYARQEISRCISEANSGKIRTKEHMDAIKASFKGKAPARIMSTNEACWLATDDIRWDSGEAIPLARGRRHTQETKEKISAANAGKQHYIHEISNEIRMFAPDSVQDGFVLYINPQWFESTVSDTVWAYNKITNTHVRISEDNIPTGYKKGRNHVGWSSVNAATTLRYIDLYTKQYCLLESHEVRHDRHARFEGHKIENINVMSMNGLVAVGIDNILQLLKFNDIIISRDELKHNVVKKPHHNNGVEMREFREKHSGKTLKEIGVEVMKLTEFKMVATEEVYCNDGRY